jgi:hypothetical protein
MAHASLLIWLEDKEISSVEVRFRLFLYKRRHSFQDDFKRDLVVYSRYEAVCISSMDGIFDVQPQLSGTDHRI